MLPDSIPCSAPRNTTSLSLPDTVKILQKGWLYFTLLWAGAILFISVIPAEDLPSLSIWEPDKVMHALVYSILCMSVVFTLKRHVPREIIPYYPKITGFALCILYGFCIEIIQRFLPTRTYDLLDIAANSMGCTFGIFIVLLAEWLGKSKQKEA